MTDRKEIAFFDVDETVLACKSMFSFLEFWIDRSGRPREDYLRHVDRMARIARAESREASNRAFYDIFAGEQVSAVTIAGEDWFRSVSASGMLLNPRAVQAIDEYRARGTLTVLVSGSFGPCLEPVRRHVGADLHRGTGLEVRDGRYTGRVTVSRIGAGKAAVVDEVCERVGADPADCHAYGDHPSDLDMLRRVGHPVVVGDDPGLAELSSRPGWGWMPGPAVAA